MWSLRRWAGRYKPCPCVLLSHTYMCAFHVCLFCSNMQKLIIYEYTHNTWAHASSNTPYAYMHSHCTLVHMPCTLFIYTMSCTIVHKLILCIHSKCALILLYPQISGAKNHTMPSDTCSAEPCKLIFPFKYASQKICHA